MCICVKVRLHVYMCKGKATCVYSVKVRLHVYICKGKATCVYV